MSDKELAVNSNIQYNFDTYIKGRGGVKIYPHLLPMYAQCKVCQDWISKDCLPLGMCSSCLLQQPEFNMIITFGHSRSKKYRTALKRAREIPTYTKEGDLHVIRFESLAEYSQYREAVERLTIVIYNWVSFSASLNGEDITAYHITCIYGEINRMRDLNKAADINFMGNIPIYTPKKPLVVDYVDDESFATQQIYGEVVAVIDDTDTQDQ